MSGNTSRNLGRSLLPVVASLALALAFWSVLLARPIGGDDWNHHYHYYDWIRTALTQYHTLPLYMTDSPHTSNLVANPQSPLLGALVWLLFYIPAGAYIKLLILLYTASGILGMFWLLRDEGVNLEIALFAGVVYAFCGFFPAHLAVGHHTFLGVYLLPAILCLFKRAIRGSTRALWLASALNVLVLFEGGNHSFIWENLFLLMFSVLTCAQISSFRPARVWFFFTLASLGLGAVKLLPMIYEFGDYAPGMRMDGFPPAAALWSLTARGQTFGTSRPDVSFPFGSGWWEFDFYVGILPLALILVGVVMARRSWPLLLVGCFFLAIALDPSGAWSRADLWEQIKDLPVWRSQRTPSRFLIVALFSFTAVGAVGLQRLLALAGGASGRRRWLRAVVAGLALLVALDLHLESRSWQAGRSGEAPVSRRHVPPIRMARAASGDTARLEEFTPHRFVVRTNSVAGGELLLMQERESGIRHWRVSGGKVTVLRRYMAVIVPAGESTITFEYAPRYFRPGLLVSLLAVIAAGFSLWLARRRNRTADPRAA